MAVNFSSMTLQASPTSAPIAVLREVFTPRFAEIDTLSTLAQDDAADPTVSEADKHVATLGIWDSVFRKYRKGHGIDPALEITAEFRAAVAARVPPALSRQLSVASSAGADHGGQHAAGHATSTTPATRGITPQEQAVVEQVVQEYANSRLRSYSIINCRILQHQQGLCELHASICIGHGLSLLPQP